VEMASRVYGVVERLMFLLEDSPNSECRPPVSPKWEEISPGRLPAIALRTSAENSSKNAKFFGEFSQMGGSRSLTMDPDVCGMIDCRRAETPATSNRRATQCGPACRRREACVGYVAPNAGRGTAAIWTGRLGPGVMDGEGRISNDDRCLSQWVSAL
jgi:hypothetical protein